MQCKQLGLEPGPALLPLAWIRGAQGQARVVERGWRIFGLDFCSAPFGCCQLRGDAALGQVQASPWPRVCSCSTSCAFQRVWEWGGHTGQMPRAALCPHIPTNPPPGLTPPADSAGTALSCSRLPPPSFPLFTIIILKHPEAKHFCRTLKKSPQIPPLLEPRC